MILESVQAELKKLNAACELLVKNDNEVKMLRVINNILRAENARLRERNEELEREIFNLECEVKES